MYSALILGGVACAGAPHPVTIPIAGGSVYVDDGGRNGVPIVFVHGNGGSSAQWREQLEHFRASGRRAIAIDLPGFGRSNTPVNGDLSLTAMAAAIDRTVEALDVKRFVIVGHSYGGAVVATYAAAHPEKVAGVVYVDAAASRLPLTQQEKDQFSAALRADKMRVVRAWFAPMLTPSPEKVREDVFASVEKTPADVLIGALMSLTAFDAKTLVTSYKGPTLAVVASDLETPLSFQRQFPDVRAVKISGAGHWLMLDKPAQLDSALDEFMSTLSSLTR
jgi:pimeloyl-ACP methyl ester carboxylesterase